MTVQTPLFNLFRIVYCWVCNKIIMYIKSALIALSAYVFVINIANYTAITIIIRFLIFFSSAYCISAYCSEIMYLISSISIQTKIHNNKGYSEVDITVNTSCYHHQHGYAFLLIVSFCVSFLLQFSKGVLKTSVLQVIF